MVSLRRAGIFVLFGCSFKDGDEPGREDDAASDLLAEMDEVVPWPALFRLIGLNLPQARTAATAESRSMLLNCLPGAHPAKSGPRRGRFG